MFNSRQLRLCVAVILQCLAAGDVIGAAENSQSQVAATIRSDVKEIVAGINAHDVERATRFNAPNIVTMEAGRPPAVGNDADRQGMAAAFKYAPSWHVSLVEESVDVSKGGDMAVYRSTYNQQSTDEKGTPLTQKVNFIAGFFHEPDGSWKMHWSVVCANERSHPDKV
jgi:ketosteroid isomerase-like protein